MFHSKTLLVPKISLEDMQYHMVQVKYPFQVPGGIPIDYGAMVMKAAKLHMPPFNRIGYGSIGQTWHEDFICKGEEHINDFIKNMNQEAPFVECVVYKPGDAYLKFYGLD